MENEDAEEEIYIYIRKMERIILRAVFNEPV